MTNRICTWIANAVRGSGTAGGFLFLFSVVPAAAFGIAQQERPPDDSLRTREAAVADSLLIADTTAIADRGIADTVLPLPAHGRALLAVELEGLVETKYDIRFQDYNGLFELIERATHVYPLSLGSPGATNHLAFFGAGPREVAVGYNGRPLADPALGFYNLEHFPVEALERIEVFTGTQAVTLADNAAGAFVNLQEIRYNTARPYTRIWYHQGGYKHIASDGVFSQNVAERLNITAGFRRQSARGRYANSYLDAWNVRGIVRWNFSDYTNISLSEVFTSHYTETNGGVDFDASPAPGNERTAQVEYPFLDERVYRHDVTLTLSSYLADDSSTALSGSAYFSHALWEKDRVPELYVLPEETSNLVTFTTQRLGVSGTFEQRLAALSLVAGGKIEQVANDRTVYFADNRDFETAAFGLLTLSPHRLVKLTGGVRLRFAEEKVHVAAGVRTDVELGDGLNVWVDLSRSARTPSVLEGTGLLNEEHLLGLGGVQWNAGAHSGQLTAFYRSERNAVVARPVYSTSGTVVNTVHVNAADAINTLGAVVQYEGRFGSIVASAFADVTYTSSGGERLERFPLLYGGATVMYEYTVGRSALRAGVRLRGLTSFRGERYIPVTWSYIPVEEESGVRGNGLDLVAGATLGNAVLRASYNNLFGQTYYYVPFYPQEEGVFRLSVSWAFLD